jgi:glycosyltransferase involved in cell wall biosynthesis
MRILFLTDNFPPETNAPASRTYEHASVWVELGHQVTVITCAPNFPTGKVFDGYKNNWFTRENINGIDVIRVKTYITANAGFIKRTLDYMSFMLMGALAGSLVKRPTVVVATSPQFFTAIAGWFVAFARRRPFVFELRDIWPASISAVGLKQPKVVLYTLEKIELFLYRRASLIVSVTHSFKQDLISRGIDGNKIKTVLNGIILKNFSSAKSDAVMARKRFGVEEKFVVGYIGTHGMAHSLGNILECAELLRDYNDITFVFIGEGAEKERLETEIARRKLTNVISSRGQPKSDMPAIFSMLDISLVSLRDTKLFEQVIPSKIFESMGVGVPIVISVPQGEATKLVVDAGAGFSCEPDNPEALANSILKLYKNKKLHSAVSAASLAAGKKYDRETLAKEMLGLLEKVSN